MSSTDLPSSESPTSSGDEGEKVMGDMDVSAITTDEVCRVLEPIWASKPETAGRVRARIEKVLDRATARKLRTGDNPARLKGNLDHLLAKQSKVKRVKSRAALTQHLLATYIASVDWREVNGGAPVLAITDGRAKPKGRKAAA